MIYLSHKIGVRQMKDGKTYNFKRILMSKKTYARKFSEKDENLYNLLLTCFNKRIETVACCAGHEERDAIKKPYITFRLNAHTRPYLDNIIGVIDMTNLIVTFDVNNKGHKKLTIKTLDANNRLFERIEKLIENEPKPRDIEEDAMKVFNFVADLKGKNTNIKMIYTEGGIKYYVNTSDDNILADIEKKLFKRLEEGNTITLNVLD